MQKLLYGNELAEFIKERQAKQVRALRQSWKTIPRLVIIQTHHHPASDLYVAKKIEYASDILIEAEVVLVEINDITKQISKYNNDKSIHGIIVQLPISDPGQTDSIVNMINPDKDIDGLGKDSKYISATALAIDWLLAGHNVSLAGKDICIIGQGRLVGRPLTKLWESQGLAVRTFDEDTPGGLSDVNHPDIIISCAGSPAIITKDMVKPGSVIVDAGLSEVDGKLVGDVSEEVRRLDDIIITPKTGGVGPLTIACLMENLITAVKKEADKSGQKDL